MQQFIQDTINKFQLFPLELVEICAKWLKLQDWKANEIPSTDGIFLKCPKTSYIVKLNNNLTVALYRFKQRDYNIEAVFKIDCLGTFKTVLYAFGVLPISPKMSVLNGELEILKLQEDLTAKIQKELAKTK